MLVLAALLAVMTTSVTMAAQTSPGRPLFGVRLALEEALLPGAATSSRVDAQLARLARRVAEVSDAVRDRDGGAAAAAARAYRETLADLRILVGKHPERASAARHSLRDQAQALEALSLRAVEETAEAGNQTAAAALDARAVERALRGASWRRIRSGRTGACRPGLTSAAAAPDPTRVPRPGRARTRCILSVP